MIEVITPPSVSQRNSADAGLRAVISWLAADFLSMLGDQFSTIAIYVMAVYALGPARAGLVLLASGIPRVLLTLLGGIVADRYSAKRIVFACDCARVIALGGSAILIAAVGVSLPSVTFVGVSLGICGAIATPPEGTLLVFALPAEDVPRFQGIRSVLVQLAAVIGGPAGGAVVAAFGAAAALSGDCVSFALVLVPLAMLPQRPRSEEPRIEAKRQGRPLAGLASGLSYVLSNPVVWSSLIVVSAMNALGSSVFGLAATQLTVERGWGPGGFGVLIGVFGVGGVTGGLLMIRLVRKVTRAGSMAALGFCAASLAFLIVALVDNLAGACLGTFAVGVGAGFGGGFIVPLIQTHTEENMMGRVMSALAVSTMGIVELSAPGAGFLVAGLGASRALVVAGAAGGLVAISALSFRPFRVARLPGR